MKKKISEMLQAEEKSKFCLELILGQDMDEFLKEIVNLSYRQPKEQTILEDGGGQVEKPKKKPISLTSYTPPEITGKEENKEAEPIGIKWLESYPEFHEMRRELCALCRYFKEKKRETGNDKFKFTEKTILTNYIAPIASLDETGESIYEKIKEEHYEC